MFHQMVWVIMRHLIVFLAATFIAPSALALRCGSDLVQRGDHAIEVLKVCGEPAYSEDWLEERYVAERPHPLLPYRRVSRGIHVEQWTYNFGSRKFMRMIRFENGVVTKIETLGYGF